MDAWAHQIDVKQHIIYDLSDQLVIDENRYRQASGGKTCNSLHPAATKQPLHSTAFESLGVHQFVRNGN